MIHKALERIGNKSVMYTVLRTVLLGTDKGETVSIANIVAAMDYMELQAYLHDRLKSNKVTSMVERVKRILKV